MVKRNGFVSNSSSSSFILIGIVLDCKYRKDEDFLEELYDSDDLDVTLENSHKLNLVGNYILDEHDTGILDENKINLLCGETLICLQKYFPDVKKEDLKIYYGTKCG